MRIWYSATRDAARKAKPSQSEGRTALTRCQAACPNRRFSNRSELAPSVLQADRQKELSIEFFTLSKSYSMGGFRIGYAIGNSDLIRALKQIKAVVDFNQYRGILNGAIAALKSPEADIAVTVDAFSTTAEMFWLQPFKKFGWDIPCPSRNNVSLGKATSTLATKLRRLLHQISDTDGSSAISWSGVWLLRRRLCAVCLGQRTRYPTPSSTKKSSSFSPRLEMKIS